MGYQNSKETNSQENKTYFTNIQDQKKDPKIFYEQSKIKQENKIQPPERNNPKKKEISQRKSLDQHPTIPFNLLFETRKSICKIVIQDNGGLMEGTGFFMKINDSKKYLITANHIISRKRKYEKISLEIYLMKK